MLKCKHCGEELPNAERIMGIDNDTIMFTITIKCRSCNHTNCFSLTLSDMEAEELL